MPSRDATALPVTLDKSLLSHTKEWVNCEEIQVMKSQGQKILELERAVLKSSSLSSFHREVSMAKFLGGRSSLEPTPANSKTGKAQARESKARYCNAKEYEISKFPAKCKPVTCVHLGKCNFISNQYCSSDSHTQTPE